MGALEQPPEQRDAWLVRACDGDAELEREVRELLAEDADDASHPLLDEGVLGPETSGHLLGALQALGSAPEHPERIGPYEIVGVLGEGGMGMVYHGRQYEPLTRDVAVKVLRPGLDGARVMARFEWERKALARLDHPNVAKVLDAGTDPESGRPYVALPLIDGLPITRYCEEHDLDLRSRLELFLKVCRAVEHAHARGVLHRDLKPGNVMVQRIDGEAVPAVIDFGIAKALDPDTTAGEMAMTVEGQRIGTPAYMSPEQLRHDGDAIDVRSDVYALGVILWEMLTGGHPFGDRVDSMTRALEVGREPTALAPPSTAKVEASETRRTTQRWRNKLRGDLDTICLTAIQFDRDRRYASAAHLADDLQRHLDGRPVLARPDSFRYRLGKSMRRHPVITTAVAGAIAVLLTGASLLILNAQRLQEERDLALEARRLAQEEAETSQTIAGFLEGLFTEVDPVVGDAAELSGRELLEQGARRAREELAGQPEMRAQLFATIGHVYHQLGLYAPAESVLVSALVDLEAIEGSTVRRDSLRAELHQSLGATLHDLGRYADGEQHDRAALGILRDLHGPRDPRYGGAVTNLAITVQAQGRLEEGIDLLREALSVHEAQPEPPMSDLAWTRSTLGYVLSKLGRTDEAEAEIRVALEFLRSLPESEQNVFELVYALNNLGGILMQQDRIDEALPYLREALDRSIEVYDEEHALVGRGYFMLGMAMRRGGDLEGARPLVARAHAINLRLLGREHVHTTRTWLGIVNILYGLGEFDDALVEAEQIKEIRDRTLGIEHPLSCDAGLWVGRLRLETGDARAALPVLEASLQGYRSVYDDEHDRVLETRLARAWALRELGRIEEARVELDGVPARIAAARGDEDAWTRRARWLEEELGADSR